MKGFWHPKLCINPILCLWVHCPVWHSGWPCPSHVVTQIDDQQPPGTLQWALYLLPVSWSRQEKKQKYSYVPKAIKENSYVGASPFFNIWTDSHNPWNDCGLWVVPGKNAQQCCSGICALPPQDNVLLSLSPAWQLPLFPATGILLFMECWLICVFTMQIQVKPFPSALLRKL